MLQAQIQPHFLYNTLETMRMLARSNKDYTVAEMAYSLGNMLRYSLSQSNDTTLQEELEHVKAYIAIHQIRIRDLQFELEWDEELLKVRYPRFILQPLVENSMIHGLSNIRGTKRIVIHSKKTQDTIEIHVTDIIAARNGLKADAVFGHGVLRARDLLMNDIRAGHVQRAR